MAVKITYETADGTDHEIRGEHTVHDNYVTAYNNPSGEGVGDKVQIPLSRVIIIRFD